MQKIIGLCAVLMASVAAAQSPTPSPAPGPSPTAASPRPRPCTAPMYRHFDFWIGRWDVVNPEGRFAGTNHITRIDGGCALHESWSAAGGGYTGQSLNSVGLDRKWHQTWVDSSGLRLELTGGLQGSSMVLEGETPSRDPKVPATRNRITWTPENPNLVRQHWETSSDLGKTWTTAFDGRYHRVSEAAAPAESFLTRLRGDWIGTGQLMKSEAHVELQIEPGLHPTLFNLRWRNVVAGDPRSLFEGLAVYTDRGQGAFTATWWDSRGTTYPIKASVTGDALTADWGESGRTVYTLLPTGDLQVVDSTKGKDGAWSEFGRATLKRK
jgi:hypothetical protein